MEELDQEGGVCEKNLMAEILLQMNNDTIKYKGSIATAKKPLGPDLNLTAEEEEVSVKITGDNTVAGEPTVVAVAAVAIEPEIITSDLHINQTSAPIKTTAVIQLPRSVAGDTSVAGKIEPPPCPFAIDALKGNNPTLALNFIYGPAGCAKFLDETTGVNTAAGTAELHRNDNNSKASCFDAETTWSNDNRSFVSPSPSNQRCPHETHDVNNPRNPDPQIKTIDSPVFCSEAPSQVFSQDQLNNMKVLLQNSVNRIGGMGTFAGTGNIHVQDHTIGSNLRPSVENYVHFGQLSSFSASSQSLRPFEPQHKVWNHSFRNNQLRPISTPSHSLDRSERVEFDLVKMFAQAKEQIHDPTPLTTVFPLGLKPKDDLLGVHKRQRTEPKSGLVLKPTWKPVRGKHVESGRSSCIRGTKGKELEEGEIREEVHSFKGFSSKLAFEQYRTFFNKNGHTPKGFNEHTLHDFPQIQSTIRGLKWDILCTVPKPYNLTWVREFFAEVSCICSFEVTVRNTKVDFSAKAINKVLNLTPPGFSKLDQLEKQASQTDLDHILEIVARPGAEWSFRGTSRVLLTQFLKPIANVWYYFVRNTLHPSNHDPGLCLIRVFLIYCIMTQQPLDVGKHISRQIKLSVSRASTKFPYPAIIHMLMAASRVPIMQADQFSRDKMVMDRQNIDRLIMNKEVVNPDYPPNDILSLGRFVYKNHVDFTAMMKEQVRNSGRTIKLLEELRGDIKEVKRVCERIEKMEKEKEDGTTPTPKGVGQV